MSTYYASFKDHARAQAVLNEIVRGGVRPDDVSLILPGETIALMSEEDQMGGPGDVTVRDDQQSSLYDDLTSVEAGRLNGVDTSDRRFTQDSVDQMDDSQEEAERSLDPRHGISQSTHESDEVALMSVTGFPTEPLGLDPMIDTVSEFQDQNAEGLETMPVLGLGLVVGSGPFGTAALGRSGAKARLRSYLREDGVPTPAILQILLAIDQREAILAVLATPGRIIESSVEAIAERNGAISIGLFDAPRYHDGEAYTS